eukprot:108984-Amphidinium_carterae.3
MSCCFLARKVQSDAKQANALSWAPLFAAHRTPKQGKQCPAAHLDTLQVPGTCEPCVEHSGNPSKEFGPALPADYETIVSVRVSLASASRGFLSIDVARAALRQNIMSAGRALKPVWEPR